MVYTCSIRLHFKRLAMLLCVCVESGSVSVSSLVWSLSLVVVCLSLVFL